MNIALDMSCAAKARPSGIARYALELARGLASLPSEHDYSMLVRASRWKNRKYFPKPPSPRFRRRLFFGRLSPWTSIDVLHALDARFIPGGHVMVSTIHDVFSAQRDDLAEDGFREKKQRQYRNIAERADRIIVPTQGTRGDLVRLFPEANSKVDIVPHGIDEALLAPDVGPPPFPTPYLLFIGLLSTRKNCVRMLHAFDRLAPSHPELRFVLAGADSHGIEEIRATLQDLTYRDRVLTPGFLDQRDLARTYRHASVFVFPTLQEGFGIPILEAMASGTPVLASDQSVPREVGSSIPHFVDPQSVEAIEDGLRLLLDEGRETERTQSGRERAATMTWKRCAEATLSVYERAWSEARQ